MARTKQIKKPCELCGREFVSSAMHQHLKKCQRENGEQTAEPVKPVSSSTEPAKTETKTERTEVIIFTEPKPEAQQTSLKEESGLSRLFGSIADFIKDHPDELMPVIATGAALFFPQLMPGTEQQQTLTGPVEDKRTWAEKGHW